MKGVCRVFKQAVIYYPEDKKMQEQIGKDIAAFRCNAAVRYMDTLNLDNKQKTVVIDSLLQEIRQDAPNNDVQINKRA